MNTIGFFLWLSTAFFLIHEFEEIIMIEPWFTGHQEKIRSTWPKKMPFGLDHAGPYLTTSIAIGIFFEFIAYVLLCLLCVIFNNYIAWYGFVAGFVLTMPLLHLRDFITFKGYTPGIITSAILFIPCIWLLYQANTILHYGLLAVVLSIVLINLIGIGLTFGILHKSMISWSERLLKYSKGETKE